MSKFVEVRVTDLTGTALDWAVLFAGYGDGPDWRVEDGKLFIVSLRDVRVGMDGIGQQEFYDPYMPSTKWSCGGPLIESQQIELSWDGSDGEAFWWKAVHQDVAQFQMGDTPLIAACRAIVAAKLGETVSVPKELLPC